MARLGHPLLGDDKYGDRAYNRAGHARQLALWASGLQFSFQAEDCPMLAPLAGQTLTSPPPFLTGWLPNGEETTAIKDSMNLGEDRHGAD
jgi:23S rRNA-/tRNA-specific pseudouridylate synthase